jgi:pimeloyl-ACP methyl ester carboxylesterase
VLIVDVSGFLIGSLTSMVLTVLSVSVRKGLRNGAAKPEMALKSVAEGVFAESHGSGVSEVVALHGWGRRGSDFADVLAGLDALAVDLPGFGASPPPPEAIGAAGYARILRPVIAGLAGPPLLVGHSFGGRVAVCLAASMPIAGLVLTGVPLLAIGHRRRPGTVFRMMRLANRMRIISDDRMEQERRRRGSSDYRNATGVMRDVLVTAVNETYEKELDLVSCPVIMVWGAEDREVPVGVAESAVERLSARGIEASLTTLAGVGHFVPTESPAALRSAIDELRRR